MGHEMTPVSVFFSAQISIADFLRPLCQQLQVGTKLNQPRSNSEVAENSPDSARNIARFIRLTALIPPLLDMVDNRKIAFNPAVELSYLSEQQQYDLCEAMEQYDCTPSLSQAQRLKEAARAGKLDKNGMELVMQEEKPNQKEVVKLSRERLNKYFPPDMPPQKIEETIVKPWTCTTSGWNGTGRSRNIRDSVKSLEDVDWTRQHIYEATVSHLGNRSLVLKTQRIQGSN